MSQLSSHLENGPDDDFRTWRRGQRAVVPKIKSL